MYQNQEQARLSAQEYANTIDAVREKTKSMSLPEVSDNETKTRQALEEQNRLVDAQASKVKKPEGRDCGLSVCSVQPRADNQWRFHDKPPYFG